jgi:hypothetical protein
MEWFPVVVFFGPPLFLVVVVILHNADFSLWRIGVGGGIAAGLFLLMVNHIKNG